MDDWRVWVGVAVMVVVVVLFFQALERAAEREYADRQDARANRTTQAVAAYATVNRAPYPLLQTLTYGPHTQVQQLPGPERAPLAPPVIAEAPPAQLPGLVTLDTLLAQGWRPSPDRLLLGIGPGETRYEVPADDKLCHVLTVGRTGYGKSSFNRLLLPQLIACGYDVYLLDVDYTPVDPKNGEEWWPIAQRTAPGDALYELDDIRAAIEDAAAEVDRRHVLRRQDRAAGAPVPWTPRFYAIEEAPELTSRYPELMDKLAHVLRRGRRVDVFALLIAQSALIKVIGGNSGDRGQFGTVAYMGGEPTSARAILGPGPEPQGRGLARLKCYGVPAAVDARIPYGTNSGIRALLGTDASPLRPTTARYDTPVAGPPSVVDAPFRVVAPVADAPPAVADTGAGAVVVDGRPVDADTLDKVRAGIAAGKSAGETAQGITGSKGGDRYGYLCRVYTACIVAMRDELTFYRTLAS